MSNVARYKDSRAATTATASQAMIVQGHCEKVLAQAPVNMSGHKELVKHERQVNDALAKGKTNANHYLNVLQPRMITLIDDMSQYFNMTLSISNLFANGQNATAIKALKIVHERTVSYKGQANDTWRALNTFRESLSQDSANFKRVADDMNIAVSGDNGVLRSLEADISSIESKISASIAGIALGGITIFAGGIVFMVGALAGFVTAGTSLPIAAAGLGIAAVGVGAVVGSSIALSNLIDSKSTLITKKIALQEEVKFAKCLEDSFLGLTASANDAVKATQQMANAWTSLENGLGSLAKQLEDGMQPGNIDLFGLFFGPLADADVKKIQADIATIRTQMAGVRIVQSNVKSPAAMIIQELARAA